MLQWIFFFGRDPVLSLAELVSVLPLQDNETSIFPLWENAVLVNGNLRDANDLLSKLGGTTKIAQVFLEAESLEKSLLEKKFEEKNFFERLPRKFFFSLSLLGKIKPKKKRTVLDILKQGFKRNRQKALLKQSIKHKEHNQGITNPGEVISWNLIESQSDLVIAKTKKSFLFARTIAVSNPGEWKYRDEKRPVKDNKEVVSIRLSKILINLAGLKQGQTLLDPFCGYATILQEAMLHGLNVIGIEKDNKKSMAAQKNLKWIQKKYLLKGTSKIFNSDSGRLASFITKNSFQGVATEPYLGPYLKKKPNPQKAFAIINELEKLYQKVFFELAKLLFQNQKVVFIFPLFEFRDKKTVKVPEKVFSKWFLSSNPLKKLGSEFSTAFPVAYQNQNNKLKREIWILQKK